MKPPEISVSQKFLNWKVILWIFLVWIAVSYFFRAFMPSNVMEVSYTDFKTSLRRGNVSQIVLEGNEVTGTYKNPVTPSGRSIPKKDAPIYKSFKPVLPSIEDPQLIDMLEKHNVTITAKPEKRLWFWTLVLS